MVRASAVFEWGTGTPPDPGATRARGAWWATRVVSVDTPPVAPALGAQIAICMATYEPDPALFAHQIDSLRAQTVDDWVCLISDDASRADVARMVGDDPRFVVSRSDTRQGFYRNFERALALVPSDAAYVALCDQDDRWYADKLARLRDALGGRALAFSDQRLTDGTGRVLRDTLWRGRAVNHDDLLSMLVANSVTGAAALFRRDLLDVLLPFPNTPGLQFHDHWLAVAALAAGGIAYVDEPLYDYVQHPGAVFGDVTSGDRREQRRSGRAAYFLGYVPRELMAVTLIERGADHPDLRRFLAAQRAPWLLARADRATTLGEERALIGGLLWRWAARARLVRDVTVPEPLAFEQRALRRWRASLT